MNWKNKLKKINLLLLLKASIGSVLAIVLASRLGLRYSSSAGITTLLTLQNTKKETVLISFKRIIAFALAIIIGSIILPAFGYTTIAFGGFVFIFVAICNLFGLQDGIIMNAVLISHALIEKRMNIDFIANELALLLIGIFIGVMLNLIMPNNMKKIKAEQERLEAQIANVLRTLSKNLSGEGKGLTSYEKQKQVFEDLDKLLDDLLLKAYEDADNRILKEARYQIGFLEMRKLQIIVVKDIFENIKELNGVFPQSISLAKFIEKMSEEFNELNNVNDLLIDLEELQRIFKGQNLPKTRDEFENRAILITISKNLKQFLMIKSTFIGNEDLKD